LQECEQAVAHLSVVSLSASDVVVPVVSRTSEISNEDTPIQKGNI